MTAGTRRTATLLALLALAGAVPVLHGLMHRPVFGGAVQAGAVLAAGVLALLPPVQRRLATVGDALRRADDRGRRWVMLAVWAGTVAYLIAAAWYVDRDLFPKSQDEHSYVIQSRMLATGRLWAPAHPAADSFESFHLLVRPVYASIYFPGTALLNAPGLGLGLPYWVVPVLAAGLVAALTYRIAAELIDGAAALLAVVVLVAAGMFRSNALPVMSQTPATLLGLAMVCAWLKWRATGHSLRWAFAIGAAAGWAAITRPADALAFAIPVGVAIGVDLWRGTGGPWTQPLVAWASRPSVPAERLAAASARAGRPSHGEVQAPDTHEPVARRTPSGVHPWLTTAAALVLPVLPFAALQVVQNLATTGDAWTPPYVTYLEQSQPGSTFGLHDRDPAATRPASRLPQKQAYYDQFLAGPMRAHGGGPVAFLAELGRRAVTTPFHLLPHPLLAAVAAASLVALCTLPRRVMAGVVVAFLALYALNPFFLIHYVIPLGPSVAVLVALGARVLADVPTRPAARAFAAAFWPAAVVGASVGGLPVFDGRVVDEPFPTPTLRFVYEQLPARVRKPALVLFTYRKGSNPHEEPVYNADVADIDDARVVKAHDLGPDLNVRLIDHYAKTQPDRHVYFYDRGTDELIDLHATAAELSVRWRESPGEATMTGDGR